jgi:signal transduction histidine kinase
VLDFEDVVFSLRRPFYITVVSVLLLMVGFVLDLVTPQALVANVVAGLVNASQGGYDTVAILNRVLAGLSFLLVGYMTLELSRITTRLTTLGFEQARTEREDALRKFFAEVSGPLRTGDFLERTATELRMLLQADAVVIVGLSQNRFALPRVTSPAPSSLGALGDTAPWIVAATPTRDMPTLSARVDTDLMTVGRWHREQTYDLVVIARRPKTKKPELVLGEALRNLEPLYERAKLLENIDQQNSELARRNTVIRDLVYAFSHDIRTPLMANAVNMKQALEGAFGELSEAYKHILQNGLSANEDLLDLADSLLLLARYESGETPPQFETLDVVKLLNDTVAHLQAPLQEKHLHLTLEAPLRLNLLGRPSELRRVLQNLLANAIKFSPSGATIEVKLHRHEMSTSEQGVRLEILDTGPGIPAEQQDRLFQRFSSGKAGGGIGLGLYLAKQIVEAHGGNIRYEAREGGGSRFVVWLPLAAEVMNAGFLEPKNVEGIKG